MRRSVVKNPAAIGGRWVEISPERLVGWVAKFGERHGGAPAVAVADDGSTVTFTAPDGSVAECHPPFPPADIPEPGAAAEALAAEALAAHALKDRTVGVLLVRLGGYAAGVFTGSPPRLTAAKTGSRLVHGRSAAGGWSQHRFARRREKQSAQALKAAADTAVTIFTAAGKLDAVVLGGDKRAAAALREDARLAPYLERATQRFLTVPDPRKSVLADTPRLYLAIKVRLDEVSS
jgi:hypothetical protein